MFKFASSLTVRCVHTYMTDGPVRPGLNTKDQTSCSEPGMLYVFLKCSFVAVEMYPRAFLTI